MARRKIVKKKMVGLTTNHFGDTTTNDLSRITGKEVDEVANKMDSENNQEETGASGAEGTMRVIVDGSVPYLEIKSNKGWVRSDSSSTSGFSFKK